MSTGETIFWTLAASVATLAGWWLAGRPGASFRGIGVPVGSLVLILCVAVCMLTLTGQDATDFITHTRRIVLGSG